MKDVPLKLFTKKLNSTHDSESKSVYKVKPESIFRYGKPKYDDFITGVGVLNDTSQLETKMQEKTRLNNNSVQPSDSSVSIQSISDEIKLANEDQKLQYYLNIAKAAKRQDIFNVAITSVNANKLKFIKKGFGPNNCSMNSNLDNEEEKNIQERSKSPDNIQNNLSNSCTDLTRGRLSQVYKTDGNPLFGDRSNVKIKNFKKSCSISKFINKSNLYRSNFNKEYQSNYSQTPNLFRKTKGMCSEFASYGMKHSFISSPFGRR